MVPHGLGAIVAVYEQGIAMKPSTIRSVIIALEKERMDGHRPFATLLDGRGVYVHWDSYGKEWEAFCAAYPGVWPKEWYHEDSVSVSGRTPCDVVQSVVQRLRL